MRLHVSVARPEQPTAKSGTPRSIVSARVASYGRRAVTALAVCAAILVPTGVTALAGSQISATINVVPPAVKSVTVSVTDLTYGSCGGGSSTANQLGFPNGHCQASGYTVTNGNTAAQIDVTGADAVPSSGATAHWTLCNGQVIGPCTGTGYFPGQNQYGETVINPTTVNQWQTALANSAQCDLGFWNSNTTCGTSAATTSASEYLVILGPSASSDGSSTFTTTVTYTAV